MTLINLALFVFGLVAFGLVGHYWVRLAVTDSTGAKVMLLASFLAWIPAVVFTGILWDVVVIWLIALAQAGFLYIFEEDNQTGWPVPP